MSTNTSYIEKVKRTQSSSFVGYWHLNEESGTTALDVSPNGYNATSAGLLRSWNDRQMVGPDGGKCAKFDGSASYVNFYSAIASEPTAEGSLSIWAATEDGFLKGTTAGYLVRMSADTNNWIHVAFDTTANRFEGSYKAGGTEKKATGSIYNIGYPPQWHHFALTWSATNDALKFYIDGLQTGTTQSSLGTWAGAMASSKMVIGAIITTPTDLFKGWLSHCALWSAILTGDEVKSLSEIGP